jgi:hypothetical protein
MVSMNDRLKDQWQHAKSEAGSAWSAIQQLPENACAAVDERPLAMTFVAFGIGIGVGVGLGLVLQEMTQEAPVPAGSFTRQAWNTVRQAVPDAFARQFQS